MRKLMTASVLILLAWGCSRSSSPTDPGVPLIPVPADVRTAPATVMVDGAALQLTTSLWRDFMPMAPPNGQPLQAILRVTELKGGKLPPGLDAQAAWVIVGNMAWFFVPATSGTATETMLEFRGVDGPRWNPGTKADVVIELRDRTGSSYRIQAKSQTIVRTD